MTIKVKISDMRRLNYTTTHMMFCCIWRLGLYNKNEYAEVAARIAFMPFSNLPYKYWEHTDG